MRLRRDHQDGTTLELLLHHAPGNRRRPREADDAGIGPVRDGKPVQDEQADQGLEIGDKLGGLLKYPARTPWIQRPHRLEHQNLTGMERPDRGDGLIPIQVVNRLHRPAE